jgi:transposase-like protein
VGAASRKYTKEYRAEAVELVVSSGQPVTQIARELGINESTLSDWVTTAKRNGTIRQKPVTADAGAELRELREENRRLRMERDFLKKAAAWFASQNQ